MARQKYILVYKDSANDSIRKETIMRSLTVANAIAGILVFVLLVQHRPVQTSATASLTESGGFRLWTVIIICLFILCNIWYWVWKKDRRLHGRRSGLWRTEAPTRRKINRNNVIKLHHE